MQCRYEEYTASSDFIRAHIFPGGHLPCMAAMVQCAQQAPVPLSVSDVKDIGPDYAVTLHEWRRMWNNQHPELLALGYDDAFIRKVRALAGACAWDVCVCVGGGGPILFGRHLLWCALSVRDVVTIWR